MNRPADTCIHGHHKRLIAPLRAAFASADPERVRMAMSALFAPDVRVRLCHPFQSIDGFEALWAEVYAPLFAAMPDLERRDFIVMAGPRWRACEGAHEPSNWVGLGGNFIATHDGDAAWLGLPRTRRPVFMRYHEYWRLEDDRVVEIEGIWDIPQLMVQLDCWPMAPQRGVEWLCPGPAHGRGVVDAAHDPERADASVRLVWDMLHDLQQGTADNPARGLGAHWHPHALWYGSTGIGTGRGHAGITDVVLRPFRCGLSDNTRHLDAGVFFGDHDLVAFTGWPSGTALHSGERFLGLAPTGRRFERRSLDFWRVEHGQIRENWVMVDLLDIYRQLGVDVLGQAEAGGHPDRVQGVLA